MEIFAGEPIRYDIGGPRHWSNNGFRRRWLANGARDAKAINAARVGDLNAVIAFSATLGGLTQRKGWARSAIRMTRKLPADIPAYRVTSRMVEVPRLTWRFRRDRQCAVIEWQPMWGV